MANLVHQELSHSTIGAAMEVLNELKPGLDEKLYERALIIELLARGHKVDTQKPFDVYYKEKDQMRAYAAEHKIAVDQHAGYDDTSGSSTGNSGQPS